MTKLQLKFDNIDKEFSESTVFQEQSLKYATIFAEDPNNTARWKLELIILNDFHINFIKEKIKKELRLVDSELSNAQLTQYAKLTIKQKKITSKLAEEKYKLADMPILKFNLFARFTHRPKKILTHKPHKKNFPPESKKSWSKPHESKPAQSKLHLAIKPNPDSTKFSRTAQEKVVFELRNLPRVMLVPGGTTRISLKINFEYEECLTY